MKIEVTQYIFRDYFNNYRRAESFSYDGLTALFEFLDDNCDENMELDVVSLCLNFTEWDTIEAFNKNHGTEFKNLDEIEEKTTVIKIENTERFITQAY